MKLTNDTYVISRDTLKKVLDALENNHLFGSGEEEDNNDDIIEAENLLIAEIKAQQ